MSKKKVSRKRHSSKAVPGAELLEVKPVEVKAEPPIEKKDVESGLIKIITMLFFGIIILFWVLVLILSIHVSFGPKQVEKNITVTYYRAINISFGNYTNGDISIAGYLKSENNMRYVSDDYGASIRLLAGKEYDQYFAENTRKVYLVTGEMNGIIIDVHNITLTRKKLMEVKEVRLDNVTVGDKAGIRIDLSDGWLKVADILG